MSSGHIKSYTNAYYRQGGFVIIMATTEPIRNKKQLRQLADYFLKRGKLRNYALIVVGACTVLRISDLLALKWSDVYNAEKDEIYTHITVIEKKTGKTRTIALNKQAIAALRACLLHRKGEFIFSSNRKEDKAISRVQAWRIIRAAVDALDIAGKISCHSLRKTWGYHACISQKVPPAIIMEIYNHSSFVTTRRYLGITQDELDAAYLAIELF